MSLPLSAAPATTVDLPGVPGAAGERIAPAGLPHSPRASTSSLTLSQSVGDVHGDSDTEKKDKEAVVEGVDPAASYPDGGKDAWMTLTGATILCFASFGATNAYGAIQAELLKGILSTSPPATVSLIGSLCIAILWVVGLPAGYLFDQGYCKWEIVGGSIFFLGGMFGLSVSKTYYQCVLAYGVAVGIGGGFLFSPAMSAVGSYFYKRRASTIGIVICGAAIGAVIFPIFFNKAFPGLGFGSTIRIAAYFQTGCFVIGNLLIRPRDLPRKDLPPTLPLIKSFLKEPMTWLVNGGCAFAMLGIFVPQFYFQTYLESKNAPQVLISYGYALINSTAAITRATIGLAADRFGFLNSILPVAYYCTLMIYVMVAANSTGGYIAYALFFGIANGAWVSLMTPCIMLLANNVNEIGVRIGLGYLFLAIPTLIGSPIAGALLTRAGGYWAPCVFGGTSFLIAAGLLTCARVCLGRKKEGWKL